jgi:hypothetical protein
MIKTTFLKNVFKPSGKVVKVYSPEEIPTLEEFRKLLEIDAQDFVFVVNGFKIDSNELKATRLNSGDYVNVFPYIASGGGGKNIAGVVAGLALMAFTGGAGGGLMSWLTASSSNMLIGGMALFLGGGLLVGNQKIPSIDTPDFSGSAFENGHSWNPDQISLKPGGAIPETFGTVRTSGQLIGRRITTKEINSESVQMLYLLLAAGEGELDSITDIQINDTASASIANLEVETRLGTNDQTAVNGILSEVAEQQTFNHELPLDSSSWVTKTQTVAGEKVILEFVHAAGVYSIGNNGAQGAVNVYNRVQYREIGASTWTDFFSSDDGYPARKTLLSDRKPVYWKHEFTPPDSTKLYEFRAQNYCLAAYNDILGWTEIPSNYSMKCSWISLTITDSDLMTYPNTALVALGIPASENLNGGMPRVSWLQTRSNIWAWNPTLEVYEQKPANKHAWAVYDTIHKCRRLKNINTGLYEFVVFGAPKENMNFAEFSDWADFEAETIGGQPRATCSFLLDSADKLWPIVQKIAAGGRGFIIQRANVFTPVWDCERVQSAVFTSGNIINGSLKGRYLSDEERATAIEASFHDEENNYKKTTILVKGDNYDPTSLQNPTQVYYPTLTNAKQVWCAAKYQLKRNQHIKREMEFRADIDSITCEIDDVIGIQSDYANWGVGGHVRGATTTQLVIDQEVTLQPGPENSYAIILRLDTGLVRQKLDPVTEATTTKTLNFTQNPFPVAPELFTLYAFGIENLETKPFKIIDIRRNGDLQATIKCLEYVEAVYSEDSNFPVINYAVKTAGINSLTVNPDSDTQKLGISWTIPEDRDYIGAVVHVNGKPIGFFGTEKTSTSIDSTAGQHTISVIPVAPSGKYGTPKTDTVTLAPPVIPQVTGISVSPIVITQTDGTCLSFLEGSFSIPAMAESVLVEIGEGANPTTWATVQDSRNDKIYYGPVKPGQLYTLRFTARNKFVVSEIETYSVTAAGDTTAPGVPSVSGSGYLKTIKLNITLNNPPATLAGFEIYRSLTPLSSDAVYKTTVSSSDGEAQHTDFEADYNQNYYYFVKAVTTWKIKSGFSAACGPIKTSPVMDADTKALMTQGMVLNSDPNFEDPSAWVIPENTGSIVDVTDGQAGTKALRGTISSWPYSKKLIPIDFDKAYRVSCLARKAAGAGGTFYLAVKLTDINSNNINGDGTWWYYAAQGVAGSTSWTKYQGYFGKNTAKPFPQNARFMQVGLILNYSSSVDYFEAQDARVTEVISADLFLANDVIINNSAQIGEALINTAHVDKIHGGKIEAGTLAITGLDSSAQNTINTAYSTANSASSAASSAQSTANSAASAASTAQTTANNAQGAANTAQSSANAAQLATQVRSLGYNQKLFTNVCGWANNTSSLTGYLIIKTPITANFMCKVRVSGYNYVSSKSNFELSLSFYAYSSGILQHSYTSSGNYNPGQIQLGRDASNKLVIVIGPSNATWSYPQIAIPEALIGYNNPPDSYKDGWSASISTSLTGISGLVAVSGLDLQSKSIANAEALAAWCYNNNLTYIDGANVYTGSIGTVQLTSDQIYGKDIRSSQNACNGSVSGTRMSAAGFEAWDGPVRNVYIPTTGGPQFKGDISGSNGTFEGFLKARNMVLGGESIGYGSTISNYTGYINIEVGPYGTLSVGAFVNTYLLVNFAGVTLEICGTRYVRSGSNDWRYGAFRVISENASYPVQFQVRFTRASSKFYIQIYLNNASFGNCQLLTAGNATGTMALSSSAQTTDITRYSKGYNNSSIRGGASLVESYQNGTTCYRKYTDKYTHQSGKQATGGATTFHVTFPTSFTNIPSVTVSTEYTAAGNGYTPLIYNVSTTGFDVYVQFGTYLHWKASGY